MRSRDEGEFQYDTSDYPWVGYSDCGYDKRRYGFFTCYDPRSTNGVLTFRSHGSCPIG